MSMVCQTAQSKHSILVLWPFHYSNCKQNTHTKTSVWNGFPTSTIVSSIESYEINIDNRLFAHGLFPTSRLVLLLNWIIFFNYFCFLKLNICLLALQLTLLNVLFVILTWTFVKIQLVITTMMFVAPISSVRL